MRSGKMRIRQWSEIAQDRLIAEGQYDYDLQGVDALMAAIFKFSRQFMAEHDIECEQVEDQYGFPYYEPVRVRKIILTHPNVAGIMEVSITRNDEEWLE